MKYMFYSKLMVSQLNLRIIGLKRPKIIASDLMCDSEDA